MEPIRTIRSRAILLDRDNIDTDQIIPARFLTTTQKTGLAAGLFAAWRFDESGREIPGVPFNRPGDRERSILVAGHNFGCGSSREHAPWALRDYGLRAVVSTGFADIFQGNAARNGLLPIVVDAPSHARLRTHSDVEITIDLPTRTISANDGLNATFPFDPFTAHCLINGLDELDYLLNHAPRITEFEESHR